MKICILTTIFPRFQGDMYGNFIYLLVKRLVEKRIIVEVVCSHYKGIQGEEMWDGIKIFRYRYMIPTAFQRLTYEGGILAALGKSHWNKVLVPFFMISFLFKGLKVGKSCNLIHAHWTISGLVALLVGKLYRKPIVLTIHGSDINVLNKKFLLKLMNRFILSKVDNIIAVSPALKEKVIEMGILQEKLWYIPNGVDPNEFCPALDNFSIPQKMLWVGRISKEKGLHILIKAMKEILKEVPQAQLTLVGDGPERRNIEQMIKDYQLEEHIHLEGFRSHLEISRYFKISHIFVLPSIREGFPLVILEALASGLPCVASDVGGVKAVIEDGVNGYLVSPSDAKDFSLKVVELMSNPDLMKEMGENARKKIVDHYSWDSIADRTIALYNQTMVFKSGKSQ